MWPGIISGYMDLLGFTERDLIVSLHEGNTPLYQASNLEKALGLKTRIYLKFEGLNPTGSFKDRGMTVAVSRAIREGTKGIICASTGNTAASAAAYAAKAGIPAFIVIPNDQIALGKLAQALAYGGEVLAVDGSFDYALELVRSLGVEDDRLALVNSVNPDRLLGQRTGAFEIVDVLGEAPDVLSIPVGNAGNISAYWDGFKQYKAAGIIEKLPALWGFQAEGAAPLVTGKAVMDPRTRATAIRIGRPASGEKALQATRESNGFVAAVSEEEIMTAWNELARLEGIFVEPASAASWAGVRKTLTSSRDIDSVVCILTGNGLKDQQYVLEQGLHQNVVTPEELEESIDSYLRRW